MRKVCSCVVKYLRILLVSDQPFKHFLSYISINLTKCILFEQIYFLLCVFNMSSLQKCSQIYFYS